MELCALMQDGVSAIGIYASIERDLRGLEIYCSAGSETRISRSYILGSTHIQTLTIGTIFGASMDRYSCINEHIYNHVVLKPRYRSVF